MRRHRAGRGRLIPACAGKTPWADSMFSAIWAHPRVCGENGEGPLIAGDVAGSSPRVRGKRMPFSTLSEDAGLIPACAGKTNGVI